MMRPSVERKLSSAASSEQRNRRPAADPAVTTFFLIRHAEHIAQGRAMVGRMPGMVLAPRGREAAGRLAQQLAAAQIDAIVSGPLERARETARIIADGLRCEPVVALELDELDYGEWTGRSLAELETDERWRVWNIFRAGSRIPGGESMLEAQLRIVALIARLVEEWPGGRIALVSHQDILKAALLYYLGLSLDRYSCLELAPASMSVLEIGPYGAVLERLNCPA
jgi:broad specificity phosphatase PhoE